MALPWVFLFWVWHALSLVAISQVRASTIAELMSQVDRFIALPVKFQAFTVALIFLIPFGLIINGRASSITSPSKIFLSVALFGLVVWIGFATNLRLIQADIAFKLAGQFNQPGSWPVAVQIYKKAVALAPKEDYYRLFLGQAYLEFANPLDAGVQKDELITQAQESLLAAQALNPLNPDHTANLARLYNLWAFMSTNPNDRLARANQADEYFTVAVQLSPNHARLWNEWSLLYRDLFQDEQRSQEILEHSLRLDSQYDWTYALFGELYLRQASRFSESGLENQAGPLLEKAANMYRSALDYVDEDAIQAIGNYKFALAEVYRQQAKYPEAIQLLSDPLLQEVVDPWRVAEQLGRLYQLQGDLVGAQAYARQALELAPQEQRPALQTWMDELEVLP